MRLVQVENYFQPQLGYQEAYFDKEFRKLGLKSSIITSDRFFPFPEYEDTTRRILGPRIFGTDAHPIIKRMGFDITNLKTHLENKATGQVIMLGLWRALNNLNPDLILAHRMYNITTIMTYFWALTKRKWIILDDHMLVKRKNLVIRFYVLFVSFLYKILPKPTYVFTISKQTQDHWLKKGIFEKVGLIPLGVDLDEFKPDYKTRIRMRDKLGISLKSFVLFYSGKIIKKKGLENTIYLAKKLEPMVNYPINIVLIGSGTGKYLERLKKQARDLEVTLIHLEMVPNSELPKFMQIADLGCWLGEIPSASIHELAGVGVPSLVSINLEMREIYHGMLKILYDPLNVNRTVKELIQLISKPKEYDEIRRRTRIFAEKRFSYRISVKTIIENMPQTTIKSNRFP